MIDVHIDAEVAYMLFCRKECSFQEISNFVKDKRAKQLLISIQNLYEKKVEITHLLNPTVKNVSSKLTLRNIADINRHWLFTNRTTLTTNLSNLLIYLQSVFSSLFNASPAIEDATRLTDNLSKIYNTLLVSVDKINTHISKIEATIFPDEVMTYIGEIRKMWVDIDLLLTNQVISPLKMSMQEYAREEALNYVSKQIFVQHGE